MPEPVMMELDSILNRGSLWSPGCGLPFITPDRLTLVTISWSKPFLVYGVSD